MIKLVQENFECFKTEEIIFDGQDEDQFLSLTDPVFDPDVLVGTSSADSVKVLQMVLKKQGLSFAIYQPDLNEVTPLLEQILARKIPLCAKIIYLKAQDHDLIHQPNSIISRFQQQGKVMLSGDYEAEYKAVPVNLLCISDSWELFEKTA